MAVDDLQVSLFDAVMCFSTAMDLVSSDVGDHQKRVSYIAYQLADELGWSEAAKDEIALAGAMHDCGAFSLAEKLALLRFDDEAINPHGHSEIGYRVLKDYSGFENLAKIIRFHHVLWDFGKGLEFRGNAVPEASHLVHLADRVDVLINKNEHILIQTKKILEQIEAASDRAFAPCHVEAFRSMEPREFFWLDMVHRCPSPVFAPEKRTCSQMLNMTNLEDLTRLFCQLMDFRSRFTATHSSGVAATAEALARLVGFSEKECRLMRIAGQLHDLGKFVVPKEILEKPAKLTEQEFDVVRGHTYFTYRILESVSGLETINSWGALHHEKLSGNGYPFHHDTDRLSTGSRIMAVSDVFTAITEDRPYRRGMTKEQVLQVLEAMTRERSLDPDIVSIVKEHYEDLDGIRTQAQAEAAVKYHELTA